jgi:LPLT family lysophospholipid transporter-like MFS transporter
MIALYSVLLASGLSIYWVIAIFGGFVAGTMYLVMAWHRYNMRVHGDQVEKLLAFARAEGGH